jgi:hypothetical protein
VVFLNDRFAFQTSIATPPSPGTPGEGRGEGSSVTAVVAILVKLDDPKVRRRSTTADDVKATTARNAGFPLLRFSAGSNLTPELVRQKLIAEWRVARAGPLPEEMA